MLVIRTELVIYGSRSSTRNRTRSTAMFDYIRSISQTVRKSPIQRLDSVSRVWGTETMATPASRAISAAAKFFVWVMWLSTMNTSLLLRWFNKIYEMSQPSNKSFIGHSAFATESPPFVSSIFTFFRLYITIGTKFM